MLVVPVVFKFHGYFSSCVRPGDAAAPTLCAHWQVSTVTVVGSAGSDAGSGAQTVEADSNLKSTSESNVTVELYRDGGSGKHSVSWYRELESLASTMLRGRRDEVEVAIAGFSRLASALGVMPVTA